MQNKRINEKTTKKNQNIAIANEFIVSTNETHNRIGGWGEYHSIDDVTIVRICCNTIRNNARRSRTNCNLSTMIIPSGIFILWVGTLKCSSWYVSRIMRIVCRPQFFSRCLLSFLCYLSLISIALIYLPKWPECNPLIAGSWCTCIHRKSLICLLAHRIDEKAVN